MPVKTIKARIDGQERTITANIPDGASNEDIMEAVSAHIERSSQRSKAPTQQPADRSTLVEAAKGFGEAVNPVSIAEGLYGAVTSPIQTAKGLVKAQIDTGRKAVDSFRKGDYTAALSQGINAAVPVLGPAFENAITQAEAEGGNTPKFLGYAAGNAAMSALPFAMRGKSIPVSPAIRNPNAFEASAMQMLQREGVTVPAGAATGNAYVKSIAKAAETTPLGAVVAGKRTAEQAGQLRNLGAKLADEASPNAIVPQQAGEGVRGALGKSAADQAAIADQAYEGFRQIEAQTPIMVDLKSIKAQLQPIYDDMNKWWEPAKKNASSGFQAIKSILNGDDAVAASQAEAGLGGLKQLAREAEGRNAGLAKFITPKLQAEIDKAVASVNPNALDLLREGRKATAQQFSVKGILDQIRQEPVQAFEQMTYAKDSGLDLLKKVQREAPGEMKKVGRAYIEDLMSKAQAEGGFSKTSSIWNKWESLGPETKKILYPDQVTRERLDKFFLGAKKLAENPNPSGSATTATAIGSTGLLFTEPVSGMAYMVGAGALAKFLNSAKAVKLLNDGMRIPITNKAAAQATALQLIKLAGKDAQPMTLQPAIP